MTASAAPAWSIPRMDRRTAYVAFAALILAVAAAPTLGLSSFLQSLVIEVLTFSILSMSLNLLIGYTGLVSFGHAAFFAVAGYGAAIAAIRLNPEVFVTFSIGIVASSLLAVVIGWLSIRLSGFYFLMITFTFAQMVYVAAVGWKVWTGGSDGLIIPGPTLFGHPVLETRRGLYYTTLVVFVVSCSDHVLACDLAVRPYADRNPRARPADAGAGLQCAPLQARRVRCRRGTGERRRRAECAIQSFISPESAHWTESAIILVMVLIGGTNFFVGPIVGTAIVLLLQHWLSSYTQYWGLVLGSLFVALITTAREGIVGVVVDGWNRLRSER